MYTNAAFARPRKRRFANPKFDGNRAEKPNPNSNPRTNPEEDRPKGFLFLRRYLRERILVIDRRALTWIEVLAIDPELEQVTLHVDGLDEPLTLNLFEEAPFLQGDGLLRLHAIQEHEHLGRTYASIGVRVPREVAIRREELIRGLSREELFALAR